MGRNRKSTRAVNNTVQILRGAALTDAFRELHNLPPITKRMLENRHRAMFSIFRFSGDGMSNPVKLIRDSMTTLGLDSNNIEHQQLYAALFSVPGEGSVFSATTPTIDDEEFRREIQQMGEVGEGKIIGGLRINSSAAYDNDVDVSTTRSYLLINEGNEKVLLVDNVSFETSDPNNSAPGLGAAMLASQMYALRRIAAITGVKVRARTVAISNRTGAYVGMNVWPKMGYNFLFDNIQLPERNTIRQYLANNGFPDIKDTATLMQSQLPNGVTGAQVWNDAVNYAISQHGYITGSGSSDVTDDNDVGVQVMQNYMRQKGYIKSGTGNIGDGMRISVDDDAILNAIWQQVGKVMSHGAQP